MDPHRLTVLSPAALVAPPCPASIERVVVGRGVWPADVWLLRGALEEAR
ncbi:hypothetical protein GR927_20510 [Mycolicibacterium sp. 3033]|nr:hypothetical protein [Mycolicibacterium aurantiacum]